MVQENSESRHASKLVDREQKKSRCAEGWKPSSSGSSAVFTPLSPVTPAIVHIPITWRPGLARTTDQIWSITGAGMGKQASLRSLSLKLPIPILMGVKLFGAQSSVRISLSRNFSRNQLIDEPGWRDGVGWGNGKCSNFHKNLAVKWANQLGGRGFWRSW